MAQLPDWQPLDGIAPPISVTDGVPRVVVVVASARSVAEGWAPAAALDLARGWSGQGARVMLIDCGLEHPTLHLEAGVPNREGLSDAVFHGASVARVARRVHDGAFFLVTAGAPVADGASVARSARWNRLSDGMTSAGVTVVLYVRDQDEAAASFLGSASDLVVLAAEGEPSPVIIRDLAPLVRGVTGFADARVAGSSRKESARTRRGPASAAHPNRSESGAGRMIFFLIVAIGIAAFLGLMLTSGLG